MPYELPPRPPPDKPTPPEEKQGIYHRAAQFTSEQTSRGPYTQAQQLIFEDASLELSAYRFMIAPMWFVAVLGLAPPQVIDERIQTMLSVGQPVDLPDHILRPLMDRRTQQTRRGEWVEQHYRPKKHSR